jgi:hypothetical protein
LRARSRLSAGQIGVGKAVWAGDASTTGWAPATGDGAPLCILSIIRAEAGGNRCS